uniref:HicB_like antitoxin of toxin-antitoxin system n=1 Tax=Candidatus Kentrum sp. DK TaxID=2126562 RepID=A0A450S407_9GAMM|nr:MAG: HicB_like antitoxin of toxin-antitoxin system [Candidatus Kentron sp. DK]
MKFKILFHPAEEGGFWAEIPGLPGCISEGGDLDETLANIREAAEGWIAVAGCLGSNACHRQTRAPSAMDVLVGNRSLPP